MNLGLTFSWVVLVPMVGVFLEEDDDEGPAERVQLVLAQGIHLLANPQKVHHKVTGRIYFDFHGWRRLFFLVFKLASLRSIILCATKICLRDETPMFFCTFYSVDEVFTF